MMLIKDKVNTRCVFYISYLTYCLISYIMICYYSFYLLLFSDITISHTSQTTHIYYDKLIVCALQYLIIDTIQKIYDKHVSNLFPTHTTMYIIMLIHHILGISMTLYAYITNISAISIISLYTFELSTIFLIFFTFKPPNCNDSIICKKIRQLALYPLWLSFLIIRIIYGNIMVSYLYYLSQTQEYDSYFVYASHFMYIFLLVANNTGFYKLNKIYRRRTHCVRL